MQSAGVTSASKPPVIALVVAMAENRVIGRGGALPWALPSDLKTFRRVTLGKPVIMGRKTFASIGCALDGRLNIVVTRQANFAAAGVVRAGNLADAIAHAGRSARETGAAEIMVIGGADIYAQCMPLAWRLYLTIVHATPEGDTWFPPIDASWREVTREALPKTERDEFSATLTVLERGRTI